MLPSVANYIPILLGSEGTEGGTYIGMVKANIDTIAKALK